LNFYISKVSDLRIRNTLEEFEIKLILLLISEFTDGSTDVNGLISIVHYTGIKRHNQFDS